MSVDEATNIFLKLAIDLYYLIGGNSVVHFVWFGILYLLEMVLNITCNRIDRKISYNTCGIVKFVIEYDDCANINPVIMTATCGIYSNTCDPFCVEQCVLVWTLLVIIRNVPISLLEKLWSRWL